MLQRAKRHETGEQLSGGGKRPMGTIARDKAAALISITVTIFLVALKYSIGVLLGSIAPTWTLK